MRTGIVAFILGNISFLYYLPPDWSELSIMKAHVCCQLLFIILVFSLLIILYKSRTIIVSSFSVIYKDFYLPLIYFIVMFFCGYFFSAIYVNQFYPVLDLDHIEGKTILVKGLISKRVSAKIAVDLYE